MSVKLKKISSQYDTKCRMFCFPYAGGNANIYRGWGDILGKYIDIYAFQLPGRGDRYSEMPYTEISAVVKEFIDEWRGFDEKPFVFFGHSLGALIAFESARLVQELYGLHPEILFGSGSNEPKATPKKKISNLKKEDFLLEIKEMGGTPEEIFQNCELIDLIYPMLKADFKMNEDYLFHARAALDSKIIVYEGKKDKYVDLKNIDSWKHYTTKECCIHLMDGGHFFINELTKELLDSILYELNCLNLVSKTGI